MLTNLLLLLFLASGKEKQDVVVCLDPGHSKQTVGAVGKRLAEYKVCWDMAARVKVRLEKRGVTVVLTKPNGDANVTNEERAAIANRAGAGLFLRLHCDAAAKPGIATYYPDRPGTKDGIRGPSPEVRAASKTAAAKFHARLMATLNGALRDRGVKTDRATNIGGKQGALTGSIHARVPVLLIEMGVITNKHDEAFLASEKGKNLLADALTEGCLAAVKPEADSLAKVLKRKPARLRQRE